MSSTGTTAPTVVRRSLVPLAWASLVANVVIVVTGGAVRLTASGLGCPTWPRCTDASFRPHGSLGIHGAIEFGNRLLTFVLVAIAIATVVVAWRSGRRVVRRLAVLLFLGIPAQAVIGGITVLTDLNPWIVALHFLVSMAMICAAVLLVREARRPATAPYAPRSPLAPLAWATFAVGWVALYLGTVVTGSGPHAGDLDAPRNGLDPAAASQAHADAVFVLLGLSVALLLVVRLRTQAGPLADAEARRAVGVLMVVLLAQGAVGFVQYATDLPIVLVALHMLGASLMAAAMTWALVALLRPEPASYDAAPAVADRRRGEPVGV
ncbi:COX15/CtaA family protein [Nocardioides sp. AX2bis]|uniref:COX15/CtaA family protein n=1 Tax=Nocardioides sp. AX2bis TaxID=2653157 RepID=UPI0012F3D053|nr:COX15/CtaA family protein [Nocardioides sp. AX2bis]VXB50308.1 Cytochrome c oxidase assembly protein subunit 15 [Nocardioides sp. AX2bis]